MFDLSKMSDQDIKRLLAMVGMRKEVIEELFKVFTKKVSPQPKGYVPSQNITRQLITNSITIKGQQNNPTEIAKMITIGNLSNSPYPIPWYWLKTELAEDLVKVDFSETIPQEFNLPRLGIIVLPKGLLKTSTGNIDYIAYYLFMPGENSDFQAIINDDLDTSKVSRIQTQFTGKPGHRLAWATSQVSYVYAGIYGLLPEDNCYKIIAEEHSYLENPELEDKETKQISGLLLNCLIYASQNETQYLQTQGKGFSTNNNKKKNKKRYDRPIFIGENYKSVVRKAIAENQDKGTPKKLHWRRGHWRRVAVGEGRKQRAWRLIPPVIVGFKKGEN